jgi:hypothetical protein
VYEASLCCNSCFLNTLSRDLDRDRVHEAFVCVRLKQYSCKEFMKYTQTSRPLANKIHTPKLFMPYMHTHGHFPLCTIIKLHWINPLLIKSKATYMSNLGCFYVYETQTILFFLPYQIHIDSVSLPMDTEPLFLVMSSNLIARMTESMLSWGHQMSGTRGTLAQAPCTRTLLLSNQSSSHQKLHTWVILGASMCTRLKQSYSLFLIKYILTSTHTHTHI